MLAANQQTKPKITIFEYEVVMQSDEVHPEDGVPIDTQEWVSEFFNPQTEQSLNRHYEGWLEIGYHLVSFDLRQVKAKFEGDIFYRPIWPNCPTSIDDDDDEF